MQLRQRSKWKACLSVNPVSQVDCIAASGSQTSVSADGAAVSMLHIVWPSGVMLGTSASLSCLCSAWLPLVSGCNCFCLSSCVYILLSTFVFCFITFFHFHHNYNPQLKPFLISSAFPQPTPHHECSYGRLR